MSEWGAFVVLNGDGYGVGPLPGRKRIAVYRRSRAGFLPVAYFCNEECAKDFMRWLEAHVRQEADDE